MIKVKNISKDRIHVIVASGKHLVDAGATFECTEKEFSMLRSFFKVEKVAEPVIETKPVEAKEIKEEPKKAAPKKKAKK